MKKGFVYLIVTAIILVSFASTGFASSSSSWSYSSGNNWFVSTGTNSEIQYSGRITPGRNFSSGNRIAHRGWIENRMGGSRDLRMIVGHHSSRLTYTGIASISGYQSYTSSQHRLLSDGTWRVTLDYSNVPRNGWVANEVRFTARNSGFTWNATQHGGSWYQSGAGRPYSDWQFMPTGAAHMLNSVRVGN